MILFWLENIEKLNFEGSYFSQLTVEACKANMFSDASGVGYGGYIAKESNPTGITLVVCRLLQMYLKQERILSILS
jgi:L-aminopeptidase/D-esterase-like protein